MEEAEGHFQVAVVEERCQMEVEVEVVEGGNCRKIVAREH